VFYALFAGFGATWAWKLRPTLHGFSGGDAPERHFAVALGMMLVFGYFCLSSFLKAGRRGR